MSYFYDPNTHQVYQAVQPQTGDQVQTFDQVQDQAAVSAPAAPQAYAVQAPAAEAPAPTFLGLDATSATFWKGAILGAGVALLVTNETVQKAVVKAVSKGMAAASSGVAEIKEKFEDAKAEVEAEAAGK